MTKQKQVRQGRRLKAGKVRKGPFGVRAKNPRLLSKLMLESEARMRKRATRTGR